jgi:hypothetical protein
VADVRAGLALVVVVAGCTPDGIEVLRPTARSNDGGLDTRPSLCSLAGAALCEGFEGELLGYPPWGLVEYAGAATIDPTRTYRGQHGLRAHLAAQAGGPSGEVRQAEVTQDVAVPLPALYLRMFLYLPAPGPPDNVRFAAALQRFTPYDGIGLWYDHGFIGYSGIDTSLKEHISATRLPLDRWVCVEWLIGAGAAGTSQVWVDGVDVADLHVSGPTQPAAAPLGRTSFGAALFGVPMDLPTYDLWMDELLVDSRRIGCDG